LVGTNDTARYELDEDFALTVQEAASVNFSLIVNDDDFLIPSGQESYYNESLTITINSTNSSDVEVDLFNFSFVSLSSSLAEYNAILIPSGAQVGNYTVFVNITDYAGNSTNRTFYLNITETFDAPNITSIDNKSLTIYDYLNFTVNATDDEDDRDNLNL